MKEVSTIGLDIAKSVFQVHGVDAAGKRLFNRKLQRAKVLPFFAEQPRCLVALEACGGAHHWARQLLALGHDVRLVPAAYVKQFLGRHKSDALDAAAICKAVRLSEDIHYVPVKSEEQQASVMIFRLRDMLVRQRTQTINALRGHMAEFGWVAPQGPAHIARLREVLDGEEAASLPTAARAVLEQMLAVIAEHDARIETLDKDIERRARQDPLIRRLLTIPGIGPIAATAIAAIAPPLQTFARARDFAAWLGLTPLQKATGGRQKLGKTSKMGERTIRRLLIIGASAVVRHAGRRDPETEAAKPETWLTRLLARKPRMLAIVALANKTARIVWAVATKQENYRIATLKASAATA